jgi:thiol-disulfide isomerase/thioredoxin
MKMSPLSSRSGASALVLVLVGLALSAGCGSSPSPEAGGAVEEAISKTGGRDVAPDFTATDLDGAEFNLSDTDGQVRLIDFWATWCAPCREEIPMLVELDRKYGDKGLKIIAISDESADVLREFEERMGVTYKNLVDSGEVAEEFLVLGLPTGFLLDREGNIVERYVGPKPARTLEKQIRELLELPPV